MLRLRDIMTTDVLTLTPETSIREAMEALARRHVSGAPVVAGGTLVGIVTASDLISFASSLPGAPSGRDPEKSWEDEDDWRKPDAEIDGIPPGDTAASSFWQWWEDAGAEVGERMITTDSPEWNVLEEHDVGEAMTRTPLLVLPPNADVESAAVMMSRGGVHRVLVLDDGKLIGIVTSLDITKAVAEKRLTRRVYATA